MRRALIFFTRFPRAGVTKTRLLPVLSPNQCAALHTAFLRDLAEVSKTVEADLFVSYTEDPDWKRLKEIFPAAAGFFPQEGEGLGERMSRALARVLSLGYDMAVLTGTDLPMMTREHLESGFQALLTADAVLGPTGDGGYYLVGLRRPCSVIFDGQQYGGKDVCENTAAAAEAAGLTLSEALALDDVDTPEDLLGLSSQADENSHTGRYLAQLRREGVKL